MTLATVRRVGFYLTAALLVATLAGLLFSARLRHQAQRVRVKAEMTLARWRGHPPQLVSLAGNVGLSGAQIQALDSRSGWAALSDNAGRFLLLDVDWYPGARCDLILATDEQHGKALTVTLPQTVSADHIIELGDLSFDHGRPVELRDLPGITSVSYEDYDSANAEFYRNLYAQITAGKQTDEAIIGGVNDYVGTKLNYDEKQWEIGSPRRILETGSRYCGHLATAMATLLRNGNYKVREIHLSDGNTPPATHAVVEVFYDGGWHLYDPTYGTVYRNPEGAVASYRELRLAPSLIKEDDYQRLPPKWRHEIAALLHTIFPTGHHHFYAFKGKS
ncbi:MAG TPA: transglutaminase-like domain-containing protein [Blastocatellia bacterium]|nr:transglutaminase-like domain-containing protein [Blastocatellia bacterium]